MSWADEAVDALTHHGADLWYTTGQVAKLLASPPEVGVRACRQLHLDGRARRDHIGRYQLHDVRGAILAHLSAHPDTEFPAGCLADELPELGLSRAEMIGHLAALLADNRLRAWWGNPPDDQVHPEVQRGGA